MTEKDEWSERRNSSRQDAHFPCQLALGDSLFEGLTRNLSLGGLLFECASEPETAWQGKEGTITVVIGSLPYDCDCSVVRVSSKGVAVCFEDISGSPLEEAIFEFINQQLSGL